SQLEAGDHPLEVLHAVVEPEAYVVAGADADLGQHVGQPVGPRVGLCVAEAPVGAHDRLALGYGVDDRLPQVGEVEVHQDTWATKWRAVRDSPVASTTSSSQRLAAPGRKICSTSHSPASSR